MQLRCKSIAIALQKYCYCGIKSIKIKKNLKFIKIGGKRIDLFPIIKQFTFILIQYFYRENNKNNLSRELDY